MSGTLPIELSLATAMTLVGLGAFHGINPGMGWLFAVALGLQDRDRRALWRAIAALAAGHALAIGAAIVVFKSAERVIDDAVVRAVIAAALVALGVSRLVRSRHPRAGGMRVGFAGLTGWSFLMASAHGAGLMVLPFVMAAPAAASAHAHHAHGMTAGTGALSVASATLLHGMGYLAATALVAWVVYEKLGVLLIRRAWVNLDVLWAGALVATGLVAAFA